MLPVLASYAASQLLAAPAQQGSDSPSPVAAQVAPAPEKYVFVNPYANAPAPSKAEIEIIKQTVPVLAEHGVTLTTMFYKKMFGKHPELKNIFNQAHQATGDQPKSLAGAVYAYAANIENLAPVLPAVSLMAHKHASLSVLPSQYPIVGTNLLEALDELLTSAKFPKETIAAIISAWATAYGQLANILISEEEKLYSAAEAAPGGWRGWRQFVVAKKETEAASGIVSFYLKPVDGGRVPAFTAGQYTCVRVKVPGANGDSFYQPRQYTLSESMDGKNDHFRITVKKEEMRSNPHPMPKDGSASSCPFLKTLPAGVVSNILHSYAEGTVVELAPPFGDFVLNEKASTPIVLLGAGVGVTPCITMAETALKEGRSVDFLYGCHNSASHPMKKWMHEMPAKKQNLRMQVFYSKPDAKDQQGTDYQYKGRMTLDRFAAPTNADYFMCGPVEFMKDMVAQLKSKGVKAEKIHLEPFNTGMINV